MTETRTLPDPDAAPSSGAARRTAEFAGSELFAKLFGEGMDLVEDVAAYLDGPGRDDSRSLGRAGALAYAAESMRLTTRLMQAASWLLAQRAVAEGEISAAEAAAGAYRLPEDPESEPLWPADGEAAPARLAGLADRSKTLYARLKRIDEGLFAAEDGDAANPVEDQLNRLKSAFGG